MNDLNETILIKIEVPTCDCVGCYYYQYDNELDDFCCYRPTDAAKSDPCFEKKQNGKYYIFVKQPKTK